MQGRGGVVEGETRGGGEGPLGLHMQSIRACSRLYLQNMMIPFLPPFLLPPPRSKSSLFLPQMISTASPGSPHFLSLPLHCILHAAVTMIFSKHTAHHVTPCCQPVWSSCSVYVSSACWLQPGGLCRLDPCLSLPPAFYPPGWQTASRMASYDPSPPSPWHSCMSL